MRTQRSRKTRSNVRLHAALRSCRRSGSWPRQSLSPKPSGAEKKAGGKIDKGVDDTLYRSDLAEVVRPRRPGASVAVENTEVTRSSRPSEPRPAPLKLVAEQRVDRAHEPIRPRRVATPAVSRPGTRAGGDSGFAAFAAELGATTLPDLLEAATAYMSDVEGQKDFSRPMLMSKLRQATTSEFSREDGLRSFGQLLRDGKLRKLKGGRFAAMEHTEFREEARNGPFFSVAFGCCRIGPGAPHACGSCIAVRAGLG